MSAPAIALPSGKIHLPSVHVRNARTNSGYDYEEDIFVQGRGRKRRVVRQVLFTYYESGRMVRCALTEDALCDDDVAKYAESLPILLDDGAPDAQAHMQERARREYERQASIAFGSERACRGCGCSDSRECSGGCIWATETLCSRCV